MQWPPSGTFDAKAVSLWSRPPQEQQPYIPDFADNDDLKKAFAIELAQGVNPFVAALNILDQDTPKALWASVNWISDIAVIGYRDVYLKTVKAVEKPLDKSEILLKVKAFAEEKDIHGRYLVEAKDRLNAWKLYSDIQGYTGKVDISTTVNNSTENNFTKIVLVKPDPKTIEHQASNLNSKSEIFNKDAEPIKLKLVGGVS